MGLRALLGLEAELQAVGPGTKNLPKLKGRRAIRALTRAANERQENLDDPSSYETTRAKFRLRETRGSRKGKIWSSTKKKI